MISLDPEIVFVSALIFLLGGIVKGFLGFGFPIIVVSLLPFILPVKVVIVVSALSQPINNVFQLAAAGIQKETISKSWPVLATLIPGIIIGAWFLTFLDSKMILLIVGLTISGFALYELLGTRITFTEKNRVPIGLGFGFAAGIAGALTSLNGWAFILYLLGLDLERQKFRSAIAFMFLVSGFFISSAYWFVGWLDQSIVWLVLFSFLPTFLGMWLGDKMGRFVPADLFRKFVLVALVFIGGVIVYRGLG